MEPLCDLVCCEFVVIFDYFSAIFAAKNEPLEKKIWAYLCRRHCRRHRPLNVTKWAYLCRQHCRRHRPLPGAPSCLHVATLCRRQAVGTDPSTSPDQCGPHPLLCRQSRCRRCVSGRREKLCRRFSSVPTARWPVPTGPYADHPVPTVAVGIGVCRRHWFLCRRAAAIGTGGHSCSDKTMTCVFKIRS